MPIVQLLLSCSNNYNDDDECNYTLPIYIPYRSQYPITLLVHPLMCIQA